MSAPFWIILIATALLLGGVSLGAYLIAARKLYSKDREMVSSSHESTENPGEQSGGKTS